jgi:NDP-sugar pyrophosphorylase family protein
LKALILAAGRGTRLRPITDYVPKPMLPLHGRPLMEWALLPLLACGIRDYVIAVSYLAEQIENYFGGGERWGVSINYSRGRQPAGKAGEIWRARGLLRPEGEPFLVVPGDTICHLDYHTFLDFHRLHGGPVSVACSTRYRLEVGLAEIEHGNRVRSFREKPNLGQPVSTGAYLLDERILPYIAEFDPETREVDLPGDVFPRLLEDDVPIYGFVGDFPWWDVGRINDYDSLLRLNPAEVAQVLTDDYPL